MKPPASLSARSLAFPASVDRERELALKLEAEEILPRELAGEVAAAAVSLWRPEPRARKKSKGVPWATRSEEHAGCFSAVEQEQGDGAALGRIAAGSAATGFVQGDPADAEGLGAGDGLEDLVATLSAIDELPVLAAAVEFAGTATTAGELKGRARGAMRRLSRENQELHDTVALGLLDRLDGTRGSLHVNQWLSIDLLYGRSELRRESPGVPQDLQDRTLSETHSTMLKEVVEGGCAVRQLSVPASGNGVHMTLARWIKRRAPQESLDDLLDSLVQVLVIPTGAVVIQGRRKVVVGQDPAEDPARSKRDPVRVEAALGIAMTPVEAACLAAGSEDARACLRKEWLGEVESLVALSQKFVKRSSGELKKAEQDLEQADPQEDGPEPVGSEALQLHSRVEAAHAGLLEDRDAAQKAFDGSLAGAKNSLALAAHLARSLASWTDIQLRNRALAALVDIHLDRGLGRGEALKLALSSSPEQVWALAADAEPGLDPWMLFQYLLSARPLLCEEGDEVFPMKGGRPLSPASAEGVLGWGATSESHPRVEQARNGRGPYSFVSVEADMTHPCDRFAGSPDTFLGELQRIGSRASIPWQVAEVATVRILLAGGDLELTPALACAFEGSPSPLLHEQASSWLSSHPERVEDFADCLSGSRGAEGLRAALASSFIPIRWGALMGGVAQEAFSMVEGLEVFDKWTTDCWTEFATFAKGKNGACELGSAMIQLAARSKLSSYYSRYRRPDPDHLIALGRSLFVHALDSDPSGETAERVWLQILSTKPKAILRESAFLSASLKMVSPQTFRRVCSFVLTADMGLIRPRERGRWHRRRTIYPSGRIAAWLQTPSPDEAQVIAMNQQLEGDELSPAQREECERVKGVHVDRLSFQSPQGVDESANIISKWHGRAEEALGGIALRVLARIRTRVLKPWVKQLATYANTERIRAPWLQALSGSVRDSTRRWALAEALVLLDGDEEGLDEVREVGWRLALEGVDESTASRVSEWAGSCREYLSRTPAVAADLAAQPILELRTIGLELLQDASLTPALACRLAESGAPDVVAECTRYLGTLEPGSAEATEAVLLLCDSAVEAARGAGLEYLHTHEEKTISEKVLAALAGSAHDDVRLVVATYLLDPAWDGFDASGFDRSVLGRVRGGSKVKALIKKRVERTGVMASEVLLDLARGTNRSDADWAMGVLSRRAVAGEAIPEIVMCEESQG